jgi:hypothetical protein
LALSSAIASSCARDSLKGTAERGTLGGTGTLSSLAVGRALARAREDAVEAEAEAEAAPTADCRVLPAVGARREDVAVDAEVEGEDEVETEGRWSHLTSRLASVALAYTGEGGGGGRGVFCQRVVAQKKGQQGEWDKNDKVRSAWPLPRVAQAVIGEQGVVVADAEAAVRTHCSHCPSRHCIRQGIDVGEEEA